ncbi:MAG TPA: GAF domain-containing protein, partial [Burkholderiaceae bacterium]|nr:GAF domain-containing protein [Burkholderiaceae bacterium]
MGSVDAIPLHARLPVWLAAVCLRMPGIVAAGLVERSADGAPRAVACWPEDAQLPVPNDLVAHVFANGGSAWTSDDQGHCIVAHAYEVSERPRGVLVLRVRAGAGDHRRVCDLSAKIASRTWDATMLTPADVSLALAQGMAPPASPVEPVLDPKRAADVVRTVERVRLLDAVPPAPDVPLTPVKNQDTASAAASSMDTNADWAEVVALAAAPLAHADLDAAAFALAQALADRFACDRVSIGMLDGDAVRVLASAPALDFVAARALTQSIASALDECVAQGGVLLHPQNLDAPPRVIAAHAAHARAAGARCVLGVALPGAAMANEEEHVGALCLERLEGEPFRADEIERLQRVAHVLGPMLALHRAARPSRFKRFRSVVAARLAARGVPVGRSLGIVAGVLAAGVFALAFVPTEYRVGAPARVEGVVQRALAAPTDGFLKAVHVRPGDRVKADTPLAELARDDLLLSERKWSGDLAQAQAAYGAALAARDRAQIVIQLAKVEEASAQLALVQAQLA